MNSCDSELCVLKALLHYLNEARTFNGNIRNTRTVPTRKLKRLDLNCLFILLLGKGLIFWIQTVLRHIAPIPERDNGITPLSPSISHNLERVLSFSVLPIAHFHLKSENKRPTKASFTRTVAIKEERIEDCFDFLLWRSQNFVFLFFYFDRLLLY